VFDVKRIPDLAARGMMLNDIRNLKLNRILYKEKRGGNIIGD
jgi:hypothetical protein